MVTETGVALEKCKMALRQKRKQDTDDCTEPSSGGGSSENNEYVSESRHLVDSILPLRNGNGEDGASDLPPTAVGGLDSASIASGCPGTFTSSLMKRFQLNPVLLAAAPLYAPTESQLPKASRLLLRGTPKALPQSTRVSDTMTKSVDTAFVLTSLTLADRPRHTDEQVAKEQQSLTEEEREEALSDMFGRHCSVGRRPGKCARRDLDYESITFFIKQMRLYIENISDDKKAAFMEARAKCRDEEFCDSRLKQFLRCQGMNVEVRLCRVAEIFSLSIDE